MAANRYFRFAGQPTHHMSNWHGQSPSAVRRGSRELGSLGEANFYESSAPPFTRYRPLLKSFDNNARGAVTSFMRPRGVAGLKTQAGGPPLRPSGPEPLDPGEMPAWQEGYLPEPFAQPVGDDGEITMEALDLRPMTTRSATPTSLPLPAAAPFLGLSRNEQRLLLIGGAAAVGLFLWKRKKR